MHIIDFKLQEFLDELSSKSHTPGGGSVAALTGALSASLVSMVANLTAGKNKYAEHNDRLEVLLQKATEQKKEFVNLIFHDIEAFNDVMDAYSLPRGSEEERAVRHEAIQRALIKATCSPLRTMEHAREVMELANEIAKIGNIHAVSDAGVAASLAKCTAESAQLNILINIKSLEDDAFIEDVKSRSEAVISDFGGLHEDTLKTVRERISQGE